MISLLKEIYYNHWKSFDLPDPKELITMKYCTHVDAAEEWYKYEAGLGEDEVGSFDKHIKFRLDQSYRARKVCNFIEDNMAVALLDEHPYIRELAELLSKEDDNK